MSFAVRFMAWAAGVLLASIAASPGSAAVVTLNPGFLQSNLAAEAGDASITDDQDFPTALPYTETRTVDLGATSATADHDLGNAGFSIRLALDVSGNSGAGASAAGELLFSVDTAVDYLASGVLSSVHPLGYDVIQDFLLNDVTNGTTLFRSLNRGDSTANTLYTVGVASGDVTSVFGNLSGTLLPGIEYQLIWDTSFEIFTDTAPAAANGSFSFAFVPEPGTGALLAWGLALLGRARRR